MKRTLSLLLALLLALSLAGCAGPDTEKLALIIPETESLWPVPDSEQLAAACEEAGFMVTVYTGDDAVALTRTALEEGAGHFMVGLSDAAHARPVTDLLRRSGSCVVFFGARPKDAVMAAYDKAWYLGANPQKEGEQLGDALVELWKQAAFADLNGDRHLQAAVLTLSGEADARADAALSIFENYGIFCTVLNALPAGNDPYAAAKKALLPEAGTVELLLCPDPVSAAAAVKAAADMEHPAAVACFGTDETVSRLMDEGQILAATQWQPEEAARLLAAFAQNSADAQPVTDDTGLYLDANKGAVLEHTVHIVDAALLQEAPAEESSAESAPNEAAG